jgi:hypothetical protein
MPDDDTKPTCFVIMPITTPEERVESYGGEKDHFEHVFEALFKPAIEAAGFEPIPPSVTGSLQIQGEIIRRLLEADLVLCDMSILNANVFFELGVRSALDKPVAMARDHLTAEIPFDVNSIGTFEYDGRLVGWKVDRERERLAQHLREAASGDGKNELWRYFGIDQRARQPPQGTELDALELSIERLTSKVNRLTWQSEASTIARGFDRDTAFAVPIPRPDPVESITDALITRRQLDVERIASDLIAVVLDEDLSEEDAKRLRGIAWANDVRIRVRDTAGETVAEFRP